jgi:very-short-patch-repair endonuclease
VAQPESPQVIVNASLDTWKRQLLDLTRRNRALNFRPLKVSTIAIVDEAPAEVFRLLYDEEHALTFAAVTRRAETADRVPPAVEEGPAPAEEAADPFDEELAVPEAGTFEPYAPATLPPTHADLVLQTTLEPEALDRGLRRIEEQARLSLEERGVNTLFLALGLLHYTEAEASDEVFRAPIVLLPVTLRRSSARAPFTLTVGDDEPMVNPALAELMRRQFGLAMPDLPTAENSTLQEVFTTLQERLATVPEASATPAWKVTSDIYLGLFSFQKLVMYKDLEANAAAVTGHRLVHQLITRRGLVKGGGIGLPDDVRDVKLDEAHPPEHGAHVVDADGSQQRALAAVERGYDLVVEGPPGTGKSQTITNLVAQALHAGKRVLFVAEKMAALDVVHQRLQQAGLGEFCLELHSTRSSKREVIKSIAAALDASLQTPAAPGDAAARLPEVREALGAYVAALHDRFGAMAAAPFEAYGALAHVIEAPRVDWPGNAEGVTRPAHDQAMARLRALAAAAEAAGDIATHPWRDTERTFYPQDQLDAVIEAATDVAHRIPEVRHGANEVHGALGLPRLASLADLERVRAVIAILRDSPGAPRDVLDSTLWNAVPSEAQELIAAVREIQRLEAEVGARFVPDAQLVDHADDIAYMNTRGGVFASLFWWLDARQRAIRTRWTSLRRPGYTPASFIEQAHDLKAIVALRAARAALDLRQARGVALFGHAWQGAASDPARLDAYGAWVVAFRQMQQRERLPASTVTLVASGHVDLTAADRLVQHASALGAAVQRLTGLVQWRAGRPGLDSLPFEALHERVAALVTESPRAARWAAFVAAQQEVRDTVAGPLLEVAEAGRVTWAQLPNAAERAFWFAWLARAVEARPPLARFQALAHEQRVQEFQDLDRAVLADNRARLVASLRTRVQARLRDEDVDAAMPVLRREMAKQRNHRPLRETLRQAEAAVRAIKPVFLMSPLSVAQFTRGDAPGFDLVVFDEASQLPPEDAVGAIVRGAQLVVVGDPKQLPPTDFFAAPHEVQAAAEASDDGVEVPDAESILEAFMGCGVPMSRLKWHYRSAHESLISFSNVSFYDGDLLTFPSVEPLSVRLGLTFEHVEDGIYEGKGLNLAEARRVASAVVDFARAQVEAERAGGHAQSLGVGTFNLRQQLAILDVLEERRREEPAIEPFFDRSRPEPFFVKNLENIQGDERDVIFLSVTYAKGRDGRLRQHFGPLNGENGWRRLNVLTTRARRAMRVFASMRAHDIHDGQSRGGPLLKAFLEYAESGRLDHPALQGTGRAESPFEREVVRDLARRGHLVESQIGVAGYRIDIGVRDPEAPGRFLLGIECDGVAYHASETARDRDRLRQQVLEGRGWTILRIWSTDWFKDRAGQMDRLEQVIARARSRPRATAPPVERRPAAPASPARPFSSAAEDATAGAPPPMVPLAYEKAGPPARLPGDATLDCDLDTLATIVTHVVALESPVHEDDVVARVAGYWDQRAGTKIRAHVLAAGERAVRQRAIERRGAFLWAPGSACQPRDRSGTGIGADRIAPEEYEAAVRASLGHGRVSRRETLLAEARSRLGFERTGPTIAAALEAAIDRLVASATLGEGSEGYRLR